MGVFKILKSLCKEMNDAMSAFWWGDTEEQKKLDPLVCLVVNVYWVICKLKKLSLLLVGNYGGKEEK
jgi:hypothetical protein